jgi:phosphoribosylglycinamide formyltransferase 1
MKNIAIFASGSGSNAQKIAEYFTGSNEINIAIILTNNKDAGVIDRAKNLNIPCYLFDKEAYKNGEVLSILTENDIDFVVLAGFLWLVPKQFIEAFPNKIINLHPALLPKFGGKGMYGHHVHEAVIEAGEKESGITIHYVNEAYDEGAIIFQAKYSIDENDSAIDIANKGQVLEHKHFPKVIEEIVLGNK